MSKRRKAGPARTTRALLRARLISPARIDRCILFLREQTVMPDRDLAALYAVSTKALNQAVKRNIERFPDDFMFELSPRRTPN